MVAQLLRLRLALLANAFHGAPRLVFAMVAAAVGAAALTGVIGFSIVGLHATAPVIAHSVIVVFGAVVVLAYFLVPLVFGVDDAMDPRRFALYGIPAGPLSTGLVIAALPSGSTVVVAVFAIAQVGVWARTPGLAFLAVLAAAIIVGTCVLGSRIVAALAAVYLSGRRARELAGIALLATVAVAAPIVAVLATADWASRVLPALRQVAAIVAWTPLGAAWSIPGEAASGSPEGAVGALILSGGFLGILWLVWRRIVATMVMSPVRRVAPTAGPKLGWFALMPPTSTGAVAGRSLSYWTRDPRYLIQLAAVPVAPMIMVAALFVGGAPWSVIAWVPVPVMCLILGWTVHNDLAHDSTAFWTHVSSNTSGVSDRWGRIVPPLLLGVPLVLVGSLVTVALSGAWASLPGLIGLSGCVLSSGLGISSFSSARFPYAAVHPGDSPFTQPQSAGQAGSIPQSLSFFAIVLFSLPPLALVIFASVTADPIWHWGALTVGLIVGASTLVGGVQLGARALSRRGPELLAFLLRS